MNASQITKTLNKVKETIELSKTDNFYKASLGYHRLLSLPVRVKKNFDLAANLRTKWDGKKAIENQTNFLEELTEQEFINWLKLA